MKRILSAFLAFALLLTTSYLAFAEEQASPKSKDAIFEKMIVGDWAEGESPYGITSTMPDGTYKAYVYENSTKQELLYSAEGKWWIKDGRLYEKLDQITPPLPPLKPGDVIVDVIVDITESTATYIDDEGKQYTNTRIK